LEFLRRDAPPAEIVKSELVVADNELLWMLTAHLIKRKSGRIVILELVNCAPAHTFNTINYTTMFMANHGAVIDAGLLTSDLCFTSAGDRHLQLVVLIIIGIRLSLCPCCLYLFFLLGKGLSVL